MTNRTSQAVEQMGKGGIEQLASRPVRTAIAEKYRFMEATLCGILDGTHRRDLRLIHKAAKDALAFDPLDD